MRFAKMLVFALLAIGAMGTVASAQSPGYVAVYFNEGLSQESALCPNAPPHTVPGKVYIAGVNWNMLVNGIQFKVDYPAAAMTWIADQNGPAVEVGTTATGYAAGFSPYVNGFFPFKIVEAVFWWECSDCTEEYFVPVVGHPTQGGTVTATEHPLANKVDGIGLTARICSPVPVEDTTWGQVKSLYGD